MKHDKCINSVQIKLIFRCNYCHVSLLFDKSKARKIKGKLYNDDRRTKASSSSNGRAEGRRRMTREAKCKSRFSRALPLPHSDGP